MSGAFHEAEWVTFARMGELNENRSFWEDWGGKQLIGPEFALGDFRLVCEPHYLPAADFGPPEYGYYVYEANSRTILTGTTTKADAISAARGRIRIMGPQRLAEVLERYGEPYREEKAAREASAAIAKAKEEKRAAKKLKVGRRRRQIFAASNGVCHYCRTTLELTGDWHVEHKMPKALGGSDADFNLVASCVKCNLQKKDKTDVEFFALLAARNQQD